MAILRGFLYFLVAPFHPMWAFGRLDEDPSNKVARRAAHWGSLLLLCILFYFLVPSKEAGGEWPKSLNTITFVSMKWGAGVGIFFFVGLITGLILGIRDSPGHLMGSVLGLSMLPEFIFLILNSQFPESYSMLKFFTYVWRTTIICLGLIVVGGLSPKNATIFGVVSSLALFFSNYNFFPISEDF